MFAISFEFPSIWRVKQGTQHTIPVQALLYIMYIPDRNIADISQLSMSGFVPAVLEDIISLGSNYIPYSEVQQSPVKQDFYVSTGFPNISSLTAFFLQLNLH